MGVENGSASQPYKKIQTAVNAATTNTVIKVAGGIYQESVKVNYKKVHLCGGWSSDFATRDPSTYPSIVKSPGATAIYLVNVADTSIVGFTISDSKTGVHVYAEAWPATRNDSDPLLAGNIIENNGSLSAAGISGGVLMEGGYISLAENVIRNNKGNRGAAAYLLGESALLEGNFVGSNYGGGDHGGALYLAISRAYVYNNFISGNEVGTVTKYGWGGGMILDGGQVDFKGNIWTDNYSYSHGGALFVDEGAQALMENDLFYNNRCSLEGGKAIALDMRWDGARSKLTATNITVVENHSCKSKSAILLETGGDLVLKNSIIWSPDGTVDIHFQEGDSTVAISYSVYQRIQGAGGSNKLTEGPGQITSDPLFANPSINDYHLKSTAGRYNPQLDFWEIDTVHSPAIDAGDPSSSYARETAPNGGRVNLGVYGNTPQASRSQ